MKKRSGIVAASVVLALAIGAIGIPSAGGAPSGPPIALHTGEVWATAEADGTIVHEYRHFWDTAVNDGLFVGQRKADSVDAKVVDRLVAFDATTGEKLWTLNHAAAPVVLNGGRKVAFLPDSGSKRENAFQSIWMRGATGRVRKIVQFAERGGPGVPIFYTSGGTGVLDFTFDDRGRTMAVGIGDDYLSHLYDIWLVDVRTREARRMTIGKKSRYPDLSPDSSKLAFTKENVLCSEIGHRSGTLNIMNTQGPKEGRRLLGGNCDLYYTEPQWLANDRLVVARMTRTEAPFFYERDLVTVDSNTGEIEELLDLGDIVWFKVSHRRGLIAFFRSGEGGFSTYDLDSKVLTSVGEVDGHRGVGLAGEQRWR